MVRGFVWVCLGLFGFGWVWFGMVGLDMVGCQMRSEFIYEEVSILFHLEKFYGGWHRRLYNWQRRLYKCLLRSRPPVSEIEIELERTWETSRVGLDMVWTQV